MIISCEQCQTRFKVGDDKLANGPIRVRCSKCNHVFLASAALAAQAANPPSAVAPPPGATLPPSSLSTMPPAPAGSPFAPPSAQAPPTTVNPLGAPPTTVNPLGSQGLRPITALFNAFPAGPGPGGPPPAPPAMPSGGGFGSASNQSGLFSLPTSAPPSSSGGGFGSPSNQRGLFSLPTAAPSSSPPGGGFRAPSNRSGIFRPPTGTMPAVGGPVPSPPPSPFAPPPQASSPGTLPFGTPAPFGAPRAAPDPFAPRPTPGQSPGAVADPFAAQPTVGAKPSAMADPFGLGKAPTPAPRPPMSDPFAGLAPSPSAPSAPSAPPMSDPFGSFAPKPTTTDPFAGMPTAPSSPPSQPSSDPFAGLSTGAMKDPFAGIATAQSAPPAFGSTPPSSSSPPPPPPDDGPGIQIIKASTMKMPEPEGDPFAGMGDDPDVGMPAPSSSSSSPPHAAPSTPPPSSGGPASLKPAGNSDRFAAFPRTGADMQKLKRLEATQRVKELAWAAGQVVLFVLFIVVAVVLGRGGSPDALLRGDWRAALGGAPEAGALVAEDVRVARRTLANGMDVVLVTGVVRNAGTDTAPGARVDVKLGDGPVASGWAWSNVDGVDVDGIVDAPQTAAVSLRPPPSASLAPGDRAPFVVVAPVAAEGAQADITVVAATPPPPPPVEAAPVPLAPVDDKVDEKKPAPGATAPAKPLKPAAPATTKAPPPSVKPPAIKPPVKPLGAKPAGTP